jgi:serine/threonine protein kinase/Flp pilus assembly protein TadD
MWALTAPIMSGTSQTPSAAEPFAPGQFLVDRFRLTRRIAHGGMGVVYEAFDEKLGRRIALKCARSGYDRHLSPEVLLATAVSHPNICKIYEIHTAQTPSGPLDFFTMEFLEGPTLLERQWRGPIDRREAESIARDLCAGLAEAHRHQIIHGDMKSANVILTTKPDGTQSAVITDFGLARGARTSGIRGGSPGYMAPELYAGQPTTIASDIYALGVILRELASGFQSHELASMAAKVAALPTDATTLANPGQPHGKARHGLPARVPAARWDPIIRKCLASDPKQRYESVEQVRGALGPSLARRRLLILAAAIALSVAAAVATYWRSTRPEQSVRLEVSAVTGAPQLAASIRAQMAQINNSRQTAFSLNAAHPTHRLSAGITPNSGKLKLHAVLSDVQSGAPVTEWEANYDPAQMRYAPVALSGVVSGAFHLPPLTAYSTVNAAAKPAYQEGVALLSDDRKLDQAASAFQSAASLDPDSALPLARLAEVEHRKYFLTDHQSWLEKAIASWQQAELRNPDSAAVHRIAGLLEYERNHPELALGHMRRATELQPSDSEAFSRLGELYRQAGQFPEALQALSTARSIAPGDARIYADLADVYRVQSNLPDTIKALQRAVALAPDRSLYRSLLAQAYQDQGRFSEAEHSLRAMLSGERSQDTLLALGQVLMYESRDKEAIGFLSEAARLPDPPAFLWLCLGLANQRTGRAADARTAFQKGLTTSEQQVVQLPRNGYNHAILAYFCAQTGQTSRAAMEAAQALQLAPHHNDTLWLAALSYERIGDRATALKTMEAAPLSLLEDMHRWPEARALTSDAAFTRLLSAQSAKHY